MKYRMRPSAAQIAYEAIKEWILSGYLAPGEKIDQDAIAQKLNFSRMPIRTALDRLAADDLVIVTPHRGAIVSSVNETALNNLFDIRAQIESMTVILATMKATADDFEKLRHMVSFQEDASEMPLSSVLEQNRSFHRYIAKIPGNEVLLGLFDNLWDQSERYRRIYFKAPHSNDRVVSEHAKIVELMAKRAAQDAADYVVEHTRNSQRILLEVLGSKIEPQRFQVVCVQQSCKNDIEDVGRESNA